MIKLLHIAAALYAATEASGTNTLMLGCPPNELLYNEGGVVALQMNSKALVFKKQAYPIDVIVLGRVTLYTPEL
jgi:hypothetical protein